MPRGRRIATTIANQDPRCHEGDESPTKRTTSLRAAKIKENHKYLLGFAVGGLLGHVFLHLLPETYQQVIDSNEEDGFSRVGAAILFGFLTFLVLEKILELSNPETNPQLREASNKKIVGYLNLLANCTDNLLHGLAVGTSFIIHLNKLQAWSNNNTAILPHEIPHEFGDFAMLLKSGFERMLGATLALMFESSSHLEHMLLYILPFTAGGFLNIVVSLVPDLIQEKNPLTAFYQILCVVCGISAMSLLTLLE